MSISHNSVLEEEVRNLGHLSLRASLRNFYSRDCTKQVVSRVKSDDMNYDAWCSLSNLATWEEQWMDVCKAAVWSHWTSLRPQVNFQRFSFIRVSSTVLQDSNAGKQHRKFTDTIALHSDTLFYFPLLNYAPYHKRMGELKYSSTHS
jgi:hypothetical protein